MIRENKIKQIDSEIHAGKSLGMVTMAASIQKLYDEGRISAENAALYSETFNI